VKRRETVGASSDVSVARKRGRRDLIKNWALPDRVFFVCGTCHILAYAILKSYPWAGFRPIWIRPAADHTGNPIVVIRDQRAFGDHGYSHWPTLFAHMRRKANWWWPGWDRPISDSQIMRDRGR
jgi:hypothetical protein